MTPSQQFQQCINGVNKYCKDLDKMLKEERLRKIKRMWQAFLAKKLTEKFAEHKQYFCFPDNAYYRFN